MRMEAGLDTGPICLEERVPIEPDMTAGELHDFLAGRGARLMVRALANLERGTLQCQAQAAEGVTYAAKIGKDEGRIDFSRRAIEVHNHIRGLSPVPGAWFEVVSGDKPERIKVLRASLAKATGVPGTVLDDRLTIACRDGAIRVLQAQRAGKRPMTAEELLRGFALPAGTRL
jgi:methionyl-tRNA formyltransferase